MKGGERGLARVAEGAEWTEGAEEAEDGGLSDLNKARGESRKGAVKGAEAGGKQWDWKKMRE